MLYGSILVLAAVLVSMWVRRNREIESEILSVLLRYGEMYGLQIADAIKQDFSRRPGWQDLYSGLRRLERQGLVIARWGDKRPEERGGARRRYYRRTGKRSQLRQAATQWIQALSFFSTNECQSLSSTRQTTSNSNRLTRSRFSQTL